MFLLHSINYYPLSLLDLVGYDQPLVVNDQKTKDLLSGNWGLWGEIISIIKTFLQKGFHEGDENHLDYKDPKVFHPVCAVYRKEPPSKSVKYEILKDTIDMIINQMIRDHTTLDLMVNADKIFAQKIKQLRGNSISIPELDDILKKIHVATLRATVDGKTDIIVQLLDKNGKPGKIIRLSIKTLLFSPATLLSNSSATTGTFRVENLPYDKYLEILELYKKGNVPIKKIVKQVYKYGGRFIPIIEENEKFNSNLINVNSDIRLINAYSMIYYYRDSICLISDLVDRLVYDNPLNYEKKDKYRSIYKKLLHTVAIGHKPDQEWVNEDRITNGYLIYNWSDRVLLYMANKKKVFQDILFKNTKFDSPSYQKTKVGRFYFVGEELRIDLWFKIRMLVPTLPTKKPRKCNKKGCKIIRHNHHLTNGRAWVN